MCTDSMVILKPTAEKPERVSRMLRWDFRSGLLSAPSHARQFVLCTVAALLLISCAKTSEPVLISESFAIKTVSGGAGPYRWISTDIYERMPNDDLQFIGTSTGGPPSGVGFLGDEIQGLRAITMAISKDGRSVVFRHQSSQDSRTPEREYGIYQYTYGDSIKRLYRQNELGGMSWTRWDRAFPTDVMPFKYELTYTPKDMTWAVTATGDVFPLALLEASQLHWAAFEGRTIECAELVENGADINAETYWDFAPLDLAIIRDHQDTAIRLLRLGADPDSGKYPAFHRAVQLGRMNVVQAMLELGVEINATDEDGNSALHLAVYAGSRQTGGLSLFFNNAETARSIMDRNITSTLIRLLLEHGADPSIRDNFGRPLLDDMSMTTTTEADVVTGNADRHSWSEPLGHGGRRAATA